MAAPELSEHILLEGLHTQFVGRVLHFFEEIPSTQDAAREAAHAEAPEGAVFLTDEQTAGRGRLGRRWEAPAGSSLLLSIVLRPTEELYPKLLMVGALAAALAIEETTGLRVDLKWPNDVLLRDKKVGGVLVEGEFQGTDLLFALMGIGINVNLNPAVFTEALYPATSLSHEAGSPVSRLALAHSLLRHLERTLLQARAGERVDRLWRARLVTLDKQVQVRAGNDVIEGLAEDVDADGSLLVRRSDGSLTTIVAGDVTLQR